MPARNFILVEMLALTSRRKTSDLFASHESCVSICRSCEFFGTEFWRENFSRDTTHQTDTRGACVDNYSNVPPSQTQPP